MQDSLTLSVNYLKSQEALESLDADPYWPKWHSPWWHMTLLWEMGLQKKIPKTIVKAMIRSIQKHYLPFFPKSILELPEGCDPFRNVACHCALGTMYQVLSACGADVDKEIPWIRPWFLKYQLPDGGLNCDESVYEKKNPKSSISSTLPVLEAVLLCTPREHTKEELQFLDKGAAYLMAHKLFKSASDGKVIREEWLKICFPRFYEYDILRGLNFLARWSKLLKKKLPKEAFSEAKAIVLASCPDGRFEPQRSIPLDEKTLILEDSGWVQGRPVTLFPLLEDAVRSGAPD